LLINKKLTFVTSLKALGIYISGDLNWDVQAEYPLRKGIKLISMFKFMRKYLTERKFLKAASAHFYGTVFYACSVWFEHTKWKYKPKFNSLHYRLLRSACKDYHFHFSKKELESRCKRASPTERNKFITTSRVTKTLRNNEPSNLADLLKTTLYEEPRFPGLAKFFDNSTKKT